MEKPTYMKELLGKEVQIYPNDTYKKFGKILQFTENGVLFEITKAEPMSGYTVGKQRFISYSAKLSFEQV